MRGTSIWYIVLFISLLPTIQVGRAIACSWVQHVPTSPIILQVPPRIHEQRKEIFGGFRIHWSREGTKEGRAVLWALFWRTQVGILQGSPRSSWHSLLKGNYEEYWSFNCRATGRSGGTEARKTVRFPVSPTAITDCNPHDVVTNRSDI